MGLIKTQQCEFIFGCCGKRWVVPFHIFKRRFKQGKIPKKAPTSIELSDLKVVVVSGNEMKKILQATKDFHFLSEVIRQEKHGPLTKRRQKILNKGSLFSKKSRNRIKS